MNVSNAHLAFFQLLRQQDVQTAQTAKGTKPVKKVAQSSSSSPEDIRAVRLAKVRCVCDLVPVGGVGSSLQNSAG